MRLIVNSPPKCGNVWLCELLSKAYQLPTITVSDQAAGSGRTLQAELSLDRVEDDFVTYCHIPPLEDYFSRAVQSLGAQVIGIIRNPYDIFISLFHYIQRHPEKFNAPHNSLSKLVGRPIDSEEVKEYLVRDTYGLKDHIAFANGLARESSLTEAAFGEWHYFAHGQSEGRDLGVAPVGQTNTDAHYEAYVRAHPDLSSAFRERYVPMSWILIRYEDLLEGRAEALFSFCEQIKPILKSTCETAWDECTPEKMRKSNPRHVRSATSGEGATLAPSLLKIIREFHGESISKLGYEVL